MKNLVIAALFVFAFAANNANAQSDFDKAQRNLHLSAVNTCGMIKSKTGHDQAKILQSLENLKTQVTIIQDKYVKNPPAEYAKDPLFASYFAQIKDVANTLETKVKNENYKGAVMNCSHFCMTFGKMHAINGTIDLTDMMFNWTMQISMTQFMIDAGNYQGAKQNMKKLPMIYNKVSALKLKNADANFNKSFENIDELYHSWLEAVKFEDYTKAKEIFKNFSGAFPKVFKQSI